MTRNKGEQKVLKHALPGEADLFKNGLKLIIEHVPTSTEKKINSVEFSAFLTTFSDAYNSNWNAEDVFGRMDPIATFRSTRRAISVAWNIPSSSPEQAAENFFKVNKLLQFLYPLYTPQMGNGAGTINMGPLFRVKFGNLIQDARTGFGLLGYVNGFTMDPILEEGFFTYSSDGILKTGGVEYIPKTIRLNFEMTVVHEHPLGWRKGEQNNYFFRGGQKGFPYGMGITPDQIADPPAALVPIPTNKDNNTPGRAEESALLQSSRDFNSGNKFGENTYSLNVPIKEEK